jgi:hypothetical protein
VPEVRYALYIGDCEQLRHAGAIVRPTDDPGYVLALFEFIPCGVDYGGTLFPARDFLLGSPVDWTSDTEDSLK